jgi:hypothetical protein
LLWVKQIASVATSHICECRCAAVGTDLNPRHRDQLDVLAQALLTHEALDEADAYRIAGVAREPNGEPPDPETGP